MEKRPGVRRVLLLGDSVVEGLSIKDVNELMNVQWESLDLLGKTEVLNFGVEGYCTRSEVELLRVKGLSFKPDVVVVLFVENDFEDFSNSASNSQLTMNRPWLVNALFRHSHLFRELCLYGNLFGFGYDREPAHLNADAIGGDNVVKGLALLKELAREHDFQPLIAVWPTFGDTEIIDRPQMPDGNELRIERLSRHFGIPSVRLSEWFNEDLRQRPLASPRIAYTVGDGMHANLLGHRVAAFALKNALDQLPEIVKRQGMDSPPPLPDLTAASQPSGSPTSIPPPTKFYADDYCENGDYSLAQGRVDRASEFYRGALGIDERSTRALNGLAQINLRLRNLAEAAHYYDQILKLKPKDTQALLFRAVILEIPARTGFTIESPRNLFGWRHPESGAYMSFEEFLEVNKLSGGGGISPIGQLNRATGRLITSENFQLYKDFAAAMQRALAKYETK